jgi:hypothetical protein
MTMISKKNFIRLIKESIGDVDEMARRSMGVQRPKTDKKTGELIIKEFYPLWRPENPTKPGEMGVPDAWVVNKDKTPGGARLIIPIGTCKEYAIFYEKNKEWIEEMALSEGLEPELLYCVSKVNPTGTWKDQPRNAMIDTSYIHKGEYQSAQETIKRFLHSEIRNQFENPVLNIAFEMAGVPKIQPNNPKHIDTYGKINNDEVNYQTHSFIAFKSVEDFDKLIDDSSAGRLSDVDYVTYPLPRQFNNNYQAWKETDFSQSTYGTRENIDYNEVFGFNPKESEMIVRSDLKITGRLVEDKYNWTLQFTVKYGSKLKEQRRIKNLNLDTDIVVNKSTGYNMKKPFTDEINVKNHTIVNDMKINIAFKDGLEELVEKIEEELKRKFVKSKVMR